ncbi:phosphatidylinositol 4-kinase beta 1-like [Trifolium pratense]|uniref:phosphatidylinositol 4-kinase beta 1-like n=1 Tax=Trifolium pratense TaxID=57577 RepID=UPI001E69034C|nr:phosphatidylinositol 4-kinase beta 1-like [Trifolium pratense]
MVRFLGLTRGEDEEPREIASRPNLTSDSSENGWLIRFFDSSFFCEWIAVSYLYKHDHAGVRDYLCNRMYTLPLQGIEGYFFQVCYMMIHKPSPSLDKFVIDVCAKSLKIALKVHWFLLAELEDSDDNNDAISKMQEKCQVAATLMGEWPPLIRPQSAPTSPPGKNQVLSKIFSSKHRLLSLRSSQPAQRSMSFSPSSSGTNLQEDGNPRSPEENKLIRKFMPGLKVRDALLLRKLVEKDDDDSEKAGFLKRLLRDSKGDDDLGPKIRDAFLFRESSEKCEEDFEKDNFFKRLLRDSRGDDEYSEKDNFFKRLLRDSRGGEDEDLASSSEGSFKRLVRDSKNDSEDKTHTPTMEDEEKEGFFRKFYREKFEDKRGGNIGNSEEKCANFVEEDEKEGFFQKLFKDKIEDKRDINDKIEDDTTNVEKEEPSEFSLLKRLFRVHPEDGKGGSTNENNNSGLLESSSGSENFFRKLFRDHDCSIEDSELLGSKKDKEKCAGSPKQRSEKSGTKPPLPINLQQFRKGAYHGSLDFVLSLCETSFGLVDVFPIEDRKRALHESLAEINLHLTEAHATGGVCFPLGKGMYRVLHIPEDESVLLNSREKAPYLICVEILRCEMPSISKEASTSQKLSKAGIPLANGDAFLQKPPPWAYPLWTAQEAYRNSNDRMSRSTAQAIDQAMTHVSEAKMRIVSVNLSVEKQSHGQLEKTNVDPHGIERRPTSIYRERIQIERPEHDNDVEWVRVVLKADPGVRMEDIEDPAPRRRKEHRRIPSIVALEEVKAAAAKGKAPLGLPLKGAGQDSSDAKPRANGIIPKASDALSGELWEVKKERIKKASVHGNLPGWDLRSVIVKSGDDCRQEHLAVQLISHFYDIFQEAGLPLWLRPYEVLCTSSYTALIETIPDTASLHSIKSRYPNISSLREFYIAKYLEDSPNFKLAQRNFVESMAGYSLVCYLLQVKDRHNGNLLLDEEGHIIHIDFGFMLSNSPGGVNFESAPFKLTRELLEVMDSDAEGLPSEFFDYFKVLCIQGFLTCRKHAERIILLVEMLQDSGFPCFNGGPRTIQNLRKRFHLSLTEEQCVSLVLSLISSSLDAWRTRQYDYYQKVLNGILWLDASSFLVMSIGVIFVLMKLCYLEKLHWPPKCHFEVNQIVQ